MAILSSIIRLTIMLPVLFLANSIQAKLHDGKVDEKIPINKTEMGKNIEEKTSQAIKKLENQFKATFMAYTSENKTAGETHPNLERTFRSLNVREKRSKGSWGSCKPLCKQRCLPTCNLVCCIAPPYNVPMKTVKKLEKQLGRAYARKKSDIKKPSVHKEITSKMHEAEKKRKGDKTVRSRCDTNCKKACLPSCNFKCCIVPKEH
ncbi:hypothetical protein P5673_012821 [Acropora cervicornis]|uniref:Uncharacterized protein n=1 Tax=Acropora cervicornis TaxID=6130 RepID=A0AAD9QM82_ACRCE|nr:hypothetical protein P5673_012821 [Acropora cervicornis]